MKYQFCIRFSSVDVNSAASKAVLDCNTIFLERGYSDYTITVENNNNRIKYYALLIKSMIGFYFRIKPNSIVGVQYPLLSINNVFKYFVKLAKIKKVHFFCIVHDIHSLRTGGKDARLIKQDIANLNRFDRVIVHNTQMLKWLKQHGLQRQAVVLEVFDYLSDNFEEINKDKTCEKLIVYAGNLVKSKFIYGLPAIKNCRFYLYGPGFNKDLLKEETNVTWMGQYSPDQIPKELRGNFGLIWDGESCDACDEILGNYLNYNAPHKFSLYIASGLPVIAPANSAIGFFIKSNNLGLLVNNLIDLENIQVTPADYTTIRSNVLLLRRQIIHGYFFTQALMKTEQALS